MFKCFNVADRHPFNRDRRSQALQDGVKQTFLRIIMTYEISEMKDFCAANDIKVLAENGRNKVARDWQSAIESFLEVQAETIATAKDAEIAAEKASEQLETAVLAVGSLVVAALVSETAIGIYRSVLRVLMFSIVFTLFTIGKIGAWAWDNRDKTAVYHWVTDALQSKALWRIGAELTILEWRFGTWVDHLTMVGNQAAQVGRDRMALGLVRLGLDISIAELHDTPGQ
jgi:hypothetical protein